MPPRSRATNTNKRKTKPTTTATGGKQAKPGKRAKGTPKRGTRTATGATTGTSGTGTVTTWADHKAAWKNCNACTLCQKRSNVVLGRGVIPCDILFVGEAPGAAEDARGNPFIGPAGKVLDQLIELAAQRCGAFGANDHPRLAFTNLVACVPKYKPGEIGIPKKAEIQACSGRLNQFVQLAKPKALVMVGKHASKWCPVFIDYDFEYSIDLTHPAAIMRESVVRQDVSYDRCIIQLSELFEDVYVPF